MEPTKSVICWGDAAIGEFVYVGCEGRRPNPALPPCILRDFRSGESRSWVQVAKLHLRRRHNRLRILRITTANFKGSEHQDRNDIASGALHFALSINQVPYGLQETNSQSVTYMPSSWLKYNHLMVAFRRPDQSAVRLKARSILL
jgi:hypothetical protein